MTDLRVINGAGGSAFCFLKLCPNLFNNQLAFIRIELDYNNISHGYDKLKAEAQKQIRFCASAF